MQNLNFPFPIRRLRVDHSFGRVFVTTKDGIFFASVADLAADKAIHIRRSLDRIVVEWFGGGPLQAAPAVTGPWKVVPDAMSPYAIESGEPSGYFRVGQ